MNRLKELRKQKGDTLENLSKNLKEKFDLSLSTGQLSNYENENRTPRDTKIWDCIAEYFGVSVGYLLGYSDEIQKYFEIIELDEILKKATEEIFIDFITFLKDNDIRLTNYKIIILFNFMISIDENRGDNFVLDLSSGLDGEYSLIDED